MTGEASEALTAIMSRHLEPLLSSYGYERESRRTWVKSTDGRRSAIDFQIDRTATEVTVNISLEFQCDEDVEAVRERLFPLPVAAGDSSISTFLRPNWLDQPPGLDRWWRGFVEDQEGTGHAIRKVLEVSVLPWVDEMTSIDRLAAWCHRALRPFLPTPDDSI